MPCRLLIKLKCGCREIPASPRLVNAGSVTMMVYPVRSMAAVQASRQSGQQQQQSVQEARLYHGLKLKVLLLTTKCARPVARHAMMDCIKAFGQMFAALLPGSFQHVPFQQRPSVHGVKTMKSLYRAGTISSKAGAGSAFKNQCLHVYLCLCHFGSHPLLESSGIRRLEADGFM